jgi:hypothetical protein
MAVTLSALRFPPSIFLVLISVRGWVDARAIVRLEDLGKLKKKIHLIRIRFRDLPACSIVPQPIMLPILNRRRRGKINYKALDMIVTMGDNLHQTLWNTDSARFMQVSCLFFDLEETLKYLSWRSYALHYNFQLEESLLDWNTLSKTFVHTS